MTLLDDSPCHDTIWGTADVATQFIVVLWLRITAIHILVLPHLVLMLVAGFVFRRPVKTGLSCSQVATTAGVFQFKPACRELSQPISQWTCLHGEHGVHCTFHQQVNCLCSYHFKTLSALNAVLS